MSESVEYQLTFWSRHGHRVKQWCVILLVLGLYYGYQRFPFISKPINILVRPAVAGMALLYSAGSTWVYENFAFDAGFVKKKTHPEFKFHVQLAHYVNKRKATPLVQISVDQLAPRNRREAALKALKKFDSSADWIEPFLNQLYLGGMLDLYEPKAPLLEDLMSKVRAEGGIQNPLVRAYSEVVFSFMVQVPDQPVLRARAFSWLSDVLAEDALFLILQRLPWEKHPEVRKTMEKALWDVRAVSDRSAAKKQLLPYYRKPPWPEVKLPVAVLLTRLGHRGAANYLKAKLKDPLISEEEIIDINVALSGRRLPKELKITPRLEIELAKRERERRRQYEAAYRKFYGIQSYEKSKRILLAKAKPAAPKGERPADSGMKATLLERVKDWMLEKRKSEETPILLAKKSESRKKRKPLLLRKKRAPSRSKLASLEEPQMVQPAYQPVKIVTTDDAEEMVTTEELLASLYEPEEIFVPSPPRQVAPVDEGMPDLTFFEAFSNDVPFYQQAHPDAKKLGVLKLETAYIAFESKKVGSEWWFYIEVAENQTGWVQGSQVKLSDILKQSKPKTAKKAAPVKGKRKRPSSDKPSSPRKPSKVEEDLDWVVAAEYDVGVYERESVAAELVDLISPPRKFRVLGSSHQTGEIWFKIQVAKKKQGWVQSSEVKKATN